MRVPVRPSIPGFRRQPFRQGGAELLVGIAEARVSRELRPVEAVIGARCRGVAAECLAEGIGVSYPLGFNDGYGLAVTAATAERLQLKTISDLGRHPEIKLGLTSEFVGRADGWKALQRHYGQNGSTRESRLRAGGVSFGYSGENQCYHIGMSEQATLEWCHAQFMAEPYPGHWNHIANILNPNATRMGVGIATVGGRTIITWNFTN